MVSTYILCLLRAKHRPKALYKDELIYSSRHSWEIVITITFLQREETEAQKGQVTCLRSPASQVQSQASTPAGLASESVPCTLTHTVSLGKAGKLGKAALSARFPFTCSFMEGDLLQMMPEIPSTAKIIGLYK